MRENTNRIAMVVGSLIIGGLIGAGVALLSAPMDGKQTRAMLKDKSVEIKNKVAESASESRARAEKALEDIRDRANEAIRRLREPSNGVHREERIEAHSSH
jgi:gas vesicle protein